MHSKPGTIVVGIDGSESSARALNWALKQAVAEHRELTLVHAIHGINPAYTEAGTADAPNARTAAETTGRKVLDDARSKVEQAVPDLEVHEVFDVADPRSVLLQVSESASMVVVGSRGRGKIRSLLLGSVSVALVRHAHCPVVVTRPGNQGTVRNGIVVGVDASELSRPVLEFAYRQASLHGLPLTVFHTVLDIMAGTTAAYLANLDTIDVETDRVSLAEAMAGMSEKYPDVHVTTHVARGLPEDGLVLLGDRMDLVVVGSHHPGRLERAFVGSVSGDVVEHARCPVAVVPVSAPE